MNSSGALLELEGEGVQLLFARTRTCNRLHAPAPNKTTHRVSSAVKMLAAFTISREQTRSNCWNYLNQCVLYFRRLNQNVLLLNYRWSQFIVIKTSYFQTILQMIFSVWPKMLGKNLKEYVQLFFKHLSVPGFQILLYTQQATFLQNTWWRLSFKTRLKLLSLIKLWFCRLLLSSS